MAEEKIKRLLEELSFPILYETGGGNEYISSNIYSFTGIYVEEFTANRDLFPGKINPEDYVEANHKIREWHKHNEPGILVTEFRFKTAFGEHIWIEDYLVAVKEEGKKKYMAGIMTDVSSEKMESLQLLQRLHLAKNKNRPEETAWLKQLHLLEEKKSQRKKTAGELLGFITSGKIRMNELFNSFYPAVV